MAMNQDYGHKRMAPALNRFAGKPLTLPFPRPTGRVSAKDVRSNSSVGSRRLR